MPTYGYVCEKCGHEFDLFQRMTDKPLTSCPKELCPQRTWGRGKVKRQLGAGAGIIFKGSGFYITDYRSPSYQEAAKKEAPVKTGGGSNGGSDGKSTTTPPTAKADTKAKAASKPSS